MPVSPRRTAARAVLLALGLSAGGSGVAAAAPRAAEPTSAGSAIVGLDAAALATAGETYRGFAVDRVSRAGGFVSVRTDDLRRLREALRGVPGVRYVEDNPLAFATATPNDARYGEQYGPPMMGFPAAWNTGYGSAGVKVAVIDSGIRRTHQDFTPASRFLAGYDYVNDDGTPDDACGHGTHVIGTVAATTDNAVGVAGMSQATILPLKVLAPDLLGRCSGSHDDIAQSIIDAADQGAKVISMSLGGSSGSTTLQNAVDYAAGRGVLLVAAAGNGGSNNGVDYPGAYANVTAVAALTSAKVRASYSDGGPQVDISAPGSDVLSTGYSNDSNYVRMSGTSMATPHVAGALALALSCAPGASATALRNALYSTAEDLGATGRDDIYGHGLARVDRVVTSLCTGTPANNPPTASFTSTTSGLTVTVDGTGSSDPDGDPLTYAWNFGDGATATGATASRTYAAAGTYTVTLTVDDGRGGTNGTSASVTVTTPGDPDPGTPTITSGQATTLSIAAGDNRYYKIEVPAGRSQLQVVLDGPSCTLLLCSVDADLYTRHGSRPTDTAYACRPYTSGSDETCTHASPASGWWYVRVHGYSGSGTLTLTATVS